ncbi:perosamine synthetase [Marmoricola sp. URHA0025 HA25]
MDRIPVAGPSITEKEIAYVTAAVTDAWYAHAGGPIAQFESDFASFTGRSHAAALPSCTAGIHLALAALGIGPGDEVVVPDLTWIASSAPISYVGATPVFADVDAETLCLTAETIEACLSPRTRAVIVVDLYGAMPDMSAIQDLADREGFVVIEDAAEAIGSTYQGGPAGSFGQLSVFSFHGSKTLTTGEGGMLVTDDHALIERVNVLRDHGRAVGDRAFNNHEVAFKYKMTALQAALGLAQLERIDELTAKKRALHEWYRTRLEGRSDLSVYASRNPGVVWWMTSVQIDPAAGWDKDRLQERLANVGVDTRPLFRPLSSLAAYADEEQASIAQARNHVAYRVSPYGLNLPSALSLTETDVDRVCTELIGALDS